MGKRIPKHYEAFEAKFQSGKGTPVFIRGNKDGTFTIGTWKNVLGGTECRLARDSKSRSVFECGSSGAHFVNNLFIRSKLHICCSISITFVTPKHLRRGFTRRSCSENFRETSAKYP